MTLSDFLLARIAEDEAGPFLNAWHVGRVRAECAAKRRIVEDYADAEREVSHYDNHDNPNGGYWMAWGVRHALLGAVEELASIYGDHPDYRPEWKP